MSHTVLMKEYKALSKEQWVDIELNEDNVYQWNLALMVLNPDSTYYGGYFKAQMNFPKDYPYRPPEFRFTKPLWHPNIYPDGKLCISILHAPGEDIMSGETAGERWSPIQGVESVLISILSLLDDAEPDSPANVDASVQFRNEKEKFQERVKQDVENSKKDIPEGFIMPTHESTKPKVEEKVDEDFWQDSDAEELDLDDDFDFDDDAAHGSESDEALNNDSEDDDEFDDDNTIIKPQKACDKHERLDSDMTDPDS
jgi:ubiquitin-conjugating enzyme E2 R